jgi:hypothetical protein
VGEGEGEGGGPRERCPRGRFWGCGVGGSEEGDRVASHWGRARAVAGGGGPPPPRPRGGGGRAGAIGSNFR